MSTYSNSRPASLPRRLFAGTALVLAFSCLLPEVALAHDFEDPVLRVRLLFKKFRADLAADKQLKRCDDEALKNYLSSHLGEFLALEPLISDIAFRLTSERLVDMPEDRQKMLKAELAKFIVNDNFPLLKQACPAGRLQVLSRKVDFTVALVEARYHPRGAKPQAVDFMLLRGWSEWMVSNVMVGKSSLSDKYREQLGPSIATGGYEGLLNKLINLNM